LSPGFRSSALICAITSPSVAENLYSLTASTRFHERGGIPASICAAVSEKTADAKRHVEYILMCME
jgi:hypothetical protein